MSKFSSFAIYQKRNRNAQKNEMIENLLKKCSEQISEKVKKTQISRSTHKPTIKHDHIDFLMQSEKNRKKYYQKNIKYQMNNSQPDQLYKIIPQLVISPSGQFKYILIKCRVNGQDIATFVRGDLKFQYHADNFQEFKKELKKYGFTQLKLKSQKIYAVRGEQKYQFVCPGGGRIEHNYQGQLCSIYGYSQSYGYVNHEQAQKIISTHLGYPVPQIKLNQKDY